MFVESQVYSYARTLSRKPPAIVNRIGRKGQRESGKLMSDRFRRDPAGNSGRPEQTDVEARKAFWNSARSMTPYVAATHGDSVFILPTIGDPKLYVSNARRSEFVVLDRAVTILRQHLVQQAVRAVAVQPGAPGAAVGPAPR